MIGSFLGSVAVTLHTLGSTSITARVTARGSQLEHNLGQKTSTGVKTGMLKQRQMVTD